MTTNQANDAWSALEELGKKVTTHAEWEAASISVFGSVFNAFYNLGRMRNYDPTECRRHLALYFLYLFSQLVVEEGFCKEHVMEMCAQGYDSSKELEQLQTPQGNA